MSEDDKPSVNNKVLVKKKNLGSAWEDEARSEFKGQPE